MWYFWDFTNRLIILFNFLSSIAGLTGSYLTALGLTFTGTVLMIIYVLFASPSIKNISVHWRLYAVYGMNTFATFVFLFAWITPHEFAALIISGVISILQLLFIIFSIIPVMIFPIPSSCRLTGKYSTIGTISFELSVQRKEKVHGEGLSVPVGDDRIMVQCWFPTNGEDVPYVDRALRLIGLDYFSNKALLWTSGHPNHQFVESQELLATLAKTQGLNNFLVKHLSIARCNATWYSRLQSVAQLENGAKYPVAIYSHGLYGWRQVHHTCAERLASHGFIVLACDHTPDSMNTRSLAGKCKPFNFRCSYESGSSDEREFYSAGLERRVEDLKTIMDFVGEITNTSKDETSNWTNQLELFSSVSGRLDADNIHLWGHSYGAGTVAALCCTDERPKSAVLLDSWMYPVPDDVRKKGSLWASLLGISAHTWPVGKFQVPWRDELMIITRTKHQSHHKARDMVILDTDHSNFCDAYLTANKWILYRPNLIGRANPYAVAHAVDHTIIGFFLHNQYDTTASIEVKQKEKETNEQSEVDGTSLLHDTTQKRKSKSTVRSGLQSKVVKDLISACESGYNADHTAIYTLPRSADFFIRNNYVASIDMPDGYADYAAYEKFSHCE